MDMPIDRHFVRLSFRFETRERAEVIRLWNYDLLPRGSLYLILMSQVQLHNGDYKNIALMIDADPCAPIIEVLDFATAWMERCGEVVNLERVGYTIYAKALVPDLLSIDKMERVH